MRAGLTVSTVAACRPDRACDRRARPRPAASNATPVESIAVDLVPISEFSNIRVGSLDSTDRRDRDAVGRRCGNAGRNRPADRQYRRRPADARGYADADPGAHGADGSGARGDRARAGSGTVEETAPVPVEPARREPPPAPAPNRNPSRCPSRSRRVETPPLAVDTPRPTRRSGTEADPQDGGRSPRSAPISRSSRRRPSRRPPTTPRRPRTPRRRLTTRRRRPRTPRRRPTRRRPTSRSGSSRPRPTRQEQPTSSPASSTTRNRAAPRPGEGGETTLGRQDGRSATLSQSQIDGLVAQITRLHQRCRRAPMPEVEVARRNCMCSVAGDGDAGRRSRGGLHWPMRRCRPHALDQSARRHALWPLRPISMARAGRPQLHSEPDGFRRMTRNAPHEWRLT